MHLIQNKNIFSQDHQLVNIQKLAKFQKNKSHLQPIAIDTCFI